jgi:hypothetical protein
MENLEKFKFLRKLWGFLKESEEAMKFRDDATKMMSAVYFEDVYIPLVFTGRIVPRRLRVFVYDLRNHIKAGIYPIIRANFKLQTFSILVPCGRLANIECEGFSEIEIIADYFHISELRRMFFPSVLHFAVIYPQFEGLNSVGFLSSSFFSFGGKNIYYHYEREGKPDNLNIAPFLVPRLKRFIAWVYENISEE